MFRSQYRGGYKRPEVNSGKRIVETAGYIPAETRINMILQAGHRLAEFRKEQFDFPGGEKIDEDYYDPTRRRNYDLAEAFQEAEALNARIRAYTKNKQSETSPAKGEVEEKKSETVEEKL